MGAIYIDQPKQRVKFYSYPPNKIYATTRYQTILIRGKDIAVIKATDFEILAALIARGSIPDISTLARYCKRLNLDMVHTESRPWTA